ncbi:hypothetical protein [Cytobacillus solani]|uniref:hypothetical protein n=1 Tax=Cytobacillus solani TaxID=1637975 RepID=UPI0011509705|nr:hypothetical protein [Cytobacillus solani]
MGLHQGHYKIDKEGEIYPVGENKLKEISNLIEISNLNVLDTFIEKATKHLSHMRNPVMNRNRRMNLIVNSPRNKN